jgi:hypothetical protein
MGRCRRPCRAEDALSPGVHLSWKFVSNESYGAVPAILSLRVSRAKLVSLEVNSKSN